ncbi:MAG TPA: glycosyltransferase family 9 protein [Candidatus Sulfopaludibacter sp.]|nr:glycosyltransferase family 9 protein [Candidatus Sulfopaludibacter sp.]
MHTQSKYRLLVVRLGAMGDILHALPAVTALRRAHPGWQIDWVVEPRWSPLLAAAGSTGRDTAEPQPRQPIVDNLLFASTKEWRRAPFKASTMRELLDLRRKLRSTGYDAVLDLQGALRSAILARLTGSRRRIGEDAPRERAARWFFTERIATSDAHVIEQDLEIASEIAGDDLEHLHPALPVDPEAEAFAGQLFAEHPRRPVVLLNPGAGWGAKCWPVERYAAVAKALVERGFRILINVGPGEQPLADAIRADAGPFASALSANLARLIAVTRRIALVIAGDTGPLHLACALGRPVVGIYGPTDPSRNGPFATRFRVLRNPESRRDHTRRAEPEAGLLTIQPQEVLQAAEALLYPESASTGLAQ